MRLNSVNVQYPAVSPPLSRWERWLIGFSPLMIFIAWDDNFNMQVMAPIAVVLLFGYLVKSRGRFTDAYSFRLCLLIMGSCSVSLLTALLLDIDAITSSSIVRLAYTAMILVWYYVIADRLYSVDDVKRILLCNVFCGVIIAAGVLLRYVGGADGKIAVINIWGVPVEENYMASLLAFQFILAAAFVCHSKKSLAKLLSLACMIVICAGMLFSGSRAALLGAIFALLAMIVVYFIQGGAGRLVFRVVAIVLIGIAFFYLMDFIHDYIPTWYLDRFFRNDYLDSSNSQRIEYWLFGLEGFLSRPLFGYGVGNWSYYVDQNSSFPTSGVVVAHNTYLDALIDVGVIGFALFAILILRRFKGAYRSSAFISLLIVAFFTSFIVGGERTFFFWNSVALLSILAQCFRSVGAGAEVGTSLVFDLGNMAASPYSEASGLSASGLVNRLSSDNAVVIGDR